MRAIKVSPHARWLLSPSLAANGTFDLSNPSVFVDTPWRLHPRTEQIDQTIGSGRLGDLVRLTFACSLELHEDSSRPSHERLLTQCFLVVERLAAWIVQTPVRVVVTASLTRPLWDATVLYEGGIVASWDVGLNIPPRQWVEIVGEQASLVCDDLFVPAEGETVRYWLHGPGIPLSESRQNVAACEGAALDRLLVERLSSGDDIDRHYRTRLSMLWQLVREQVDTLSKRAGD